MIITNKIYAVKAVREPNAKLLPLHEDAHDPTSPITCFRVACVLGLKEAKDLVEAIGRLAVREFLDNPQRFIDSWGDPRTDLKKF